MNSSKLSTAATAPANTAASVEGLAFLSPTGPASVDVVTAEVTTEFQSLIEKLLPDVIEPGLTAADSGDPGTASDAPAQSANPDLATAQLLMQLPRISHHTISLLSKALRVVPFRFGLSIRHPISHDWVNSNTQMHRAVCLH